MKYRSFEGLDQQVSLLGMGTMRLPLDETGAADEDAAIALIRKSIDNGVNYVDTAYMYHDGASEVILGKALKDGYREKTLIADKMPVWLARNPEQVEKIFDEQFERLDVDFIDLYLVHNVTAGTWKLLKKHNVLDFLKAKKEEGKIGKLGFSFHDEFEFFEEVLDAFPWDFCQIQLNYMDRDFQAGVKGLKLAEERGLPVIIMEPLKGGKLANNMPPAIQELWDSAPVSRTAADWAFRWLADFSAVKVILSGMSTESQLDENLKIFDNLDEGCLSNEEKELIGKAADKFRDMIKYDCTSCRYCMPCPEKLDIPKIIDLYNQWYMYDGFEALKTDYSWLDKYNASACVGCKQCEEHCPQHLPISEIMKKTDAIYGE